MVKLAKNTRCTTIASMRYRDANAAIAFLCNAFGFEKHLVVPAPKIPLRMPSSFSAMA